MSPGVLIKGKTVTCYFIRFPVSKVTFLACKIIVIHVKLWGNYVSLLKTYLFFRQILCGMYC